MNEASSINDRQIDQTEQLLGSRQSEALAGPVNIRSLVLTGIFVLLLFYTLNFAAPVLMPITLALLLNLLLSPAVKLLARLYIPHALGAAIVILTGLAVVVGVFYALSGPAQEWLQKAPTSLYKVERQLRSLKQPIEEFKQATQKIEQAAQMDDGETKEVAVDRTSVTGLILSGTPQLLGASVAVIVLLYFLLASGESFLGKLVRVMPTLHDKKRALEVVRGVQREISHYLLTFTLINIGLGAAVAIAMAVLGVPNPLLWGALVAVLNFAPYVGALVSIVILAAVGLLTFDSLLHALLVPGSVVVLTTLEGQLLTPTILGRRLAISPVAIFIALIVWGWLWGIIGALLAVPLLVSFKIVCEIIEPLQPIATFLER